MIFSGFPWQVQVFFHDKIFQIPADAGRERTKIFNPHRTLIRKVAERNTAARINSDNLTETNS